MSEVIRSELTAAAVTGVVALLGFWASSATALLINRDRMKLDTELAERRAAVDLVLAERKAVLDRKLALAKRRAEVAEKVLVDFYKKQQAFNLAFP